jgi:hypothetical protein
MDIAGYNKLSFLPSEIGMMQKLDEIRFSKFKLGFFFYCVVLCSSILTQLFLFFWETIVI